MSGTKTSNARLQRVERTVDRLVRRGVSAGGGPVTPGAGGVEFLQSSPATTWVVEHNFGRKPSVDVVVDGERIIVNVEHINNDLLHVVSLVAISGSALLS